MGTTCRANGRSREESGQRKNNDKTSGKIKGKPKGKPESSNQAATFCQPCSIAVRTSIFHVFRYDHAAFVREGSFAMTGLVRAVVLCATLFSGLVSGLALGLVPAQAADKAYKRDRK